MADDRDKRRPLHPIQRPATSDGTPRGIASSEDSSVHEDPLATIVRRTRSLSSAADATHQGISDLRDDMKEYVTRDLDEHAELRGRMGSMDDKHHTVNEHLAGVRVDNAEVKTTLNTFVTIVQAERAEKVKAADEARALALLNVDNAVSRKKHIRGIIGTILTAIGAGIGYLIHAASH